ncbi:hypothetical protein TIFTF001_050329 [Ficus carica]|uniref:Uncharacterized protein n=1 Tax=Ficus carica TaxID=3494 RepID=A0AA87YWE1_FICCA|nr:hypothetical protein TIFTF001_050329 [Ficus carica]
METPNTETPSSSSSIVIQPTSVSFSLTSLSMRKSSASKLDYLYEVNYVSDEQKVTSEDFPLINPYYAFTKPSTTSDGIETRQPKMYNPKIVEPDVSSYVIQHHPTG